MSVYYSDDWLTMHLGDCREVLAGMDAESINCVVTSPPYWGLRDYGVGGQLGLEATPEAYTEAMVAVFRDVRRVLRKDGTVWLNLGDSYASHDPGDRRDGQFLNPDGKQYDKGRRSGPAVRNRAGIYGRNIGLKPKDRVMIPARVALALQQDGWWLRDEIVWSKPNPMPSSVQDRTTPSHEMVYLLTKSARYAYDGDAIREPVASGPSDQRKMREGLERIGGSPDAAIIGSALALTIDPQIGRYQPRHKTAADPNARGMRQAPEPGEPNAFHPLGRNKRSVWTVATQPYPEAHFATFPEALITPMILAGCPEGGVVLDPFAGSGTTGQVAERLGRRAVLIDLSTEYLDQAIKRIARARGDGEGPAVDMPVPFASDGLWGGEPQRTAKTPPTLATTTIGETA